MFRYIKKKREGKEKRSEEFPVHVDGCQIQTLKRDSFELQSRK